VDKNQNTTDPSQKNIITVIQNTESETGNVNNTSTRKEKIIKPTN